MTTMIELLLTAGGCAMAGATFALWAHGRQMLNQRIFALLISGTVTVSLFSMIGWTAVAVRCRRAHFCDLGFRQHASFAFCRPLVFGAA
jgi:hypothetical protein